MTPAQRIAEERDYLGMTRLLVANAMQVTEEEVAAWEVGCTVPDDDEMARLAALFGLPVERLNGADLTIPPPLAIEMTDRGLSSENQWEVARFMEFLQYRRPHLTEEERR
ncbi:helix-turn-helix transcriptional regulator [Streptosporangium sp. NPDC051023]|uniref:helix-turn-helix transcriptional regulator n=1 Tax=Streptosporangium sp. NPDC051023 TaxID=3155410 RepID=UPI00344B267F